MRTLQRTTTAKITTNTDTTVCAAPGAGEIRRIRAICIGVSLIGVTADIQFEDGLNGSVVYSHLAVAGGQVIRFDRDAPLELSEGNLLNAATAGGTPANWTISIIHE